MEMNASIQEHVPALNAVKVVPEAQPEQVRHVPEREEEEGKEEEEETLLQLEGMPHPLFGVELDVSAEQSSDMMIAALAVMGTLSPTSIPEPASALTSLAPIATLKAPILAPVLMRGKEMSTSREKDGIPLPEQEEEEEELTLLSDQEENDASDVSFSDSDPSSSECSDEDEPSNSLEGQPDTQTLNSPLASGKSFLSSRKRPVMDDEDEGGDDSIPKTKNEIITLDPVKPVHIHIPEDLDMKPLGTVISVVEETCVIQSCESGSRSILDIDSLVVTEDRRVVGRVFDAFGPVKAPCYTIRLPKREVPVAVMKEKTAPVVDEEKVKVVESSDLEFKEAQEGDIEISGTTLVVTEPTPETSDAIEKEEKSLLNSENTSEDSATEIAAQPTDEALAAAVQALDDPAHEEGELEEGEDDDKEKEAESAPTPPNDFAPVIIPGVTRVFYIPDLAKHIQTQAIVHLKGSDASNIWDEEVGEEEMEFSDDEKEAAYRSQKKRDRKGGMSHDALPIPQGAASVFDDGALPVAKRGRANPIKRGGFSDSMPRGGGANHGRGGGKFGTLKPSHQGPVTKPEPYAKSQQAAVPTQDPRAATTSRVDSRPSFGQVAPAPSAPPGHYPPAVYPPSAGFMPHSTPAQGGYPYHPMYPVPPPPGAPMHHYPPHQAYPPPYSMPMMPGGYAMPPQQQHPLSYPHPQTYPQSTATGSSGGGMYSYPGAPMPVQGRPPFPFPLPQMDPQTLSIMIQQLQHQQQQQQAAMVSMQQQQAPSSNAYPNATSQTGMDTRGGTGPMPGMYRKQR